MEAHRVENDSGILTHLRAAGWVGRAEGRKDCSQKERSGQMPSIMGRHEPGQCGMKVIKLQGV
jgi:hypothetical protein